MPCSNKTSKPHTSLMETKENKDNILAQSNIHREGGGRVDGQGGGRDWKLANLDGEK